ncbi:hypothetical protein [Paenibacillus sinopodophylli]|nr:hypothetical protein [Paenibacillus sinopodophylli]
MRKFKFGLIITFLVVCMSLTLSGVVSAKDNPGPVIYGEDWPERGWC